MKINIAIDGPSASGKSTLAKALAKRLNYTHIDTGAMYRACALIAHQNLIDISDEDSLLKCIDESNIHFNDFGHICIDQKDVNALIRTKQIDLLTSKISTLPRVRAKMVELQRNIAKDKGFVLDGRDIGSIVLPLAEVKIFQTASIKARAQRRFEEYQKIGYDVSLNDIESEIAKRDKRDSERSHSPLVKTKDAIELDTSALSIEEMVDKIYPIVLLKTEKESV